MSEHIKISDSEYEVMEVIWDKGDATVSEVHNALSDRKWAYNTVATFMTRLSEKGLLSSHSEGKAKIYTPKVNRELYKKELTEDFLNSIHKGSKRSMLAALFDRSVSNETIDKLMNELEGSKE